jgi:hypothetical protein
MANDETPTLAEIDGILRELEAKGLVRKKRDANGNLVMRPDSSGVPQVVWVATEHSAPPTWTEH